MKKIEIKKSELALYKAYGKTNEQIASVYGVTAKEVNEAMMSFGLLKTRKATAVKEYEINLVDDTTEKLAVFNSPVVTEVNA